MSTQLKDINMYSNKGTRRLWGRNLAIQVLTVGFGVFSSHAEAAPFAYVNSGAVIDTTNNKVDQRLPRPRHCLSVGTDTDPVPQL
jgi:hypothetical protein